MDRGSKFYPGPWHAIPTWHTICCQAFCRSLIMARVTRSSSRKAESGCTPVLKESFSKESASTPPNPGMYNTLNEAHRSLLHALFVHILATLYSTISSYCCCWRWWLSRWWLSIYYCHGFGGTLGLAARSGTRLFIAMSVWCELCAFL